MEQKRAQPEVMWQDAVCTVKGGVPKCAETASVESLLWHGQRVTPLSYFFVTLIWKSLVLDDLISLKLCTEDYLLEIMG